MNHKYINMLSNIPSLNNIRQSLLESQRIISKAVASNSRYFNILDNSALLRDMKYLENSKYLAEKYLSDMTKNSSISSTVEEYQNMRSIAAKHIASIIDNSSLLSLKNNLDTTMLTAMSKMPDFSKMISALSKVPDYGEVSSFALDSIRRYSEINDKIINSSIINKSIYDKFISFSSKYNIADLDRISLNDISIDDILNDINEIDNEVKESNNLADENYLQVVRQLLEYKRYYLRILLAIIFIGIRLVSKDGEYSKEVSCALGIGSIVASYYIPVGICCEMALYLISYGITDYLDYDIICEVKRVEKLPFLIFDFGYDEGDYVGVPVRISPKNGKKIIAFLQHLQPVIILQEAKNNKWAKIEWENEKGQVYRGWVLSKMIMK